MMNYEIQREEDGQSQAAGAQQAQTVGNETQWQRQTLRDVLLEAYREQRRVRIWRNIWRGIWAVLFLLLIIGISGGNEEEMAITGEHTALINLKGEIGDGYTDQVEVLRQGMLAAYENDDVRAILIRANSPGGSPVVSNTAFEEIKRLKAEHPDVPVYAVVEDMCASGCYYIAAASDKIFADPSSLVGSIGVIGSSFDATELMQKLGVKRRVRIAGNNKDMGDPFVPETPEQQQMWQQMLDQIHNEFIKAVRTGRGNRLKEQQNPDIFSGRAYTGIEAKSVGLIDDFGNVYSVARDVVKAPDLVDYTPEQDQLESLLGRYFGNQANSKLQQLVHRVW